MSVIERIELARERLGVISKKPKFVVLGRFELKRLKQEFVNKMPKGARMDYDPETINGLRIVKIDRGHFFELGE